MKLIFKGLNFEIEVSKVIKQKSKKGVSFFHLTQTNGVWKIIHTDDITNEIVALRKIEIIRKDDPVYRAMKFGDNELEITRAACLDIYQTFINLDKTTHGYRLVFSKLKFDDFAQLECIEVEE